MMKFISSYEVVMFILTSVAGSGKTYTHKFRITDYVKFP